MRGRTSGKITGSVGRLSPHYLLLLLAAITILSQSGSVYDFGDFALLEAAVEGGRGGGHAWTDEGASKRDQGN